MILYLGSLSLAAVVPLFATTLDTARAQLATVLEDLESDARALAADVAALQGDIAALAQELAGVTGLADGILAQLLEGPQSVLRGIQAAIDNILDGSALQALALALAAGPAVVLASLQSTLAEIQSRIASYEARIAALGTRVLGITQRMAALAARVLALKELLDGLLATKALLATAGVHLLQYSGTVAAFGPELDGAVTDVVAGGSDLAQGLVLLTTAPSPWAAVQQIFKVAP